MSCDWMIIPFCSFSVPQSFCVFDAFFQFLKSNLCASHAISNLEAVILIFCCVWCFTEKVSEMLVLFFNCALLSFHVLNDFIQFLYVHLMSTLICSFDILFLRVEQIVFFLCHL